MARKCAGPPARTHYTVAEVEAWRDRIYREHQRELLATREDYYQRGLVEGTDKLRADIRDILCIKEGS